MECISGMDADKTALLALIVLLAVLTAALMLPYFQFILAAVVIAYVLQPLEKRLSDHVSETTAAAVLLLLSVSAFLLPALFISIYMLRDVLVFARGVEEGEWAFETLEEPIAAYTGVQLDLESAVHSSSETIGQWVFGSAISVFETTVHLFIGLGLLLFLLFFLIRDGTKLVEWIEEMSPFPHSVSEELRERIDALTSAVLIGHVFVAVIQGLVAGIGLAVAGIPNVTFWTFVMIVLAFIPIIGTFAIWAPASVYLVLADQFVAGIGLFVYGTIVVGLTDEYLRPIIVHRYAEVSPSVIIVGVIGGLSAFGLMGLFIGPIIVGALKETIEVYGSYYRYGVRQSGD